MIHFLVRDITAKMGHMPALRLLFWKFIYRQGSQQIANSSEYIQTVDLFCICFKNNSNISELHLKLLFSL